VVEKGNETEPIIKAIEYAKLSKEKPTIIVVKTKIGFGAATEGSHRAHGVVLSPDETMSLREKWGLVQEFFAIDDDVKKHFEALSKEKKGHSAKWQVKLDKMKLKEHDLYEKLRLFTEQKKVKYKIEAEGKPMALRDAGHMALQQVHAHSARLWGGNADISSTTKAFIKGGGIFSHEKALATDIAFGVREHAMAAAINGLALHGFDAYCSTFLAFSDYCRPSIRLSALMGLPVHYIFSHDGIGNPPDGPTHQATEHIAALRLVPNLLVFRPCNDVETAVVYKYVYEKRITACTILSRGGGRVPCQSPNSHQADKGGYIFADAEAPRAILIATGVEVELALEAKDALEKEGIGVRVVSMPCPQLFDQQSVEHKMAVLGNQTPIIALEMGSGDAWYKYAAGVISFSGFGHSGGEPELRRELGFTPDAVVEKVKRFI
jgi:transketolase